MPKEENALMKHFFISCFISHFLGAALWGNLCSSFASNFWLFWAFLSTLVIPGSCLGLFQYPSLHLHLKKKIKSFLCIFTLFSLGRKQKGGTACGKITTLKPMNTKWGWENQMRFWRCWCRDGEIVDVLGAPALLLGWRSRSERQDSCGGAEFISSPRCLHSLPFLDDEQAGACPFIAVNVAQEAVGWWKDSREPASAYGQ